MPNVDGIFSDSGTYIQEKEMEVKFEVLVDCIRIVQFGNEHCCSP
jgi:hypothetical protein